MSHNYSNNWPTMTTYFLSRKLPNNTPTYITSHTNIPTYKLPNVSGAEKQGILPKLYLAQSIPYHRGTVLPTTNNRQPASSKVDKLIGCESINTYQLQQWQTIEQTGQSPSIGWLCPISMETASSLTMKSLRHNNSNLDIFDIVWGSSHTIYNILLLI